MIIIGAGQAGLLARRGLSIHDPIIIEQQQSLPNNHSALLRFRSDVVSNATGIPFKKVTVYKGVLNEDGHTITNNPTIRDYNAYSFKTTRKALARSIINIERSTRFIAPPGFISMLSSNANIQYGVSAKDYILKEHTRGEAIISTIPAPTLMDLLDYQIKPQFEVLPIWTINCELLDTDLYQTLYVPYDRHDPYRVSITGNVMTMEFTKEPKFIEYEILQKYLTILSIHTVCKNITKKRQNYGKIVPIDEFERQRFILWATQNYNIYSLGRYATWRPLLLDDLIKDIQIINNFVSKQNGYQRELHYNKE